MVRPYLKAALLILFATLLTPPAYLFKTLKFEAGRAWVISTFFKVSLLILGCRVKVIGQKLIKAGSLIVANHTSYIDVLVIGAVYKVRFTPKNDVAGWPVIGFLTGLSNPIYINREKKNEARLQIKLIGDELVKGSNIVIFPEGTTSNGREILPFKSSLLSVAESASNIVPITLCYDTIDGISGTTRDMDAVAWYSDMELMPHLWDLFRLKSFEVTLVVHDVLNAGDFESRKELTLRCEENIKEAFYISGTDALYKSNGCPLTF